MVYYMGVNKMSTLEVRKMQTEKIATRLVQLRKSRGETQKEVADAIGVETMTISYYESGQRIPRDEIKIKLANHYDVSVQTLFFD